MAAKRMSRSLLESEHYSPLPIRRGSTDDVVTEPTDSFRWTSQTTTTGGAKSETEGSDGDRTPASGGSSASQPTAHRNHNGGHAVHTDPNFRFPTQAILLASKLRTSNFLIGEKESLVSSQELHRALGPSKQLEIYLCTWNMSSNKPSSSLSLSNILLPCEMSRVPHVYVIAIQEAPFTGGMETNLAANSQNVQKDMADLRRQWEVSLQAALCPSHVLLHSATLGCLHLVIFVRRDLTWHCTIPQVDTYNSRPVAANRIKTKGALAMSLTLFGTSFLFINCHLPAHEDKLKKRITEYERICSNLSLCPRGTSSRLNQDVTSLFDVVFWLGDLNFRVERPPEHVLSLLHEARRVSLVSHLEMTAERPARYESLLRHDQLLKLINAGTAFNGFQEAPIGFAPSYKFVIGQQLEYDTSQARSPSYTDRILYRVKRPRSGFTQSDMIRAIHYGMNDSPVTSDHKPVYGIFSVTLRPGRHHDLHTWNTLNLGQFDRSIFQEALRRRLAAAELGQLSSTALAVGKFMSKLNTSNSKVCTIS